MMAFDQADTSRSIASSIASEFSMAIMTGTRDANDANLLVSGFPGNGGQGLGHPLLDERVGFTAHQHHRQVDFCNVTISHCSECLGTAQKPPGLVCEDFIVP